MTKNDPVREAYRQINEVGRQIHIQVETQDLLDAATCVVNEVHRLREVIRKAPHDPACQVNVHAEALCDCFKSETFPMIRRSK